jgi:hypothetical protein
MTTDIPGQLEYLRPAFDELSRFDPEDLGDDNQDAIDVVEAAVRGRVAGLSAEQASAAVQSDAERIAEWSSSPGAPDTAAYVYGVLFGMTMFADFDELTSGT